MLDKCMYQDKSLRDKLHDKLRVVSSSPSHCMLVPACHTLVIPRGERLRWAWASLLAALACCSASIARKAALDGSMGKERDAVEPTRRTRQLDIHHSHTQACTCKVEVRESAVGRGLRYHAPVDAGVAQIYIGRGMACIGPSGFSGSGS
jgi:hypothetical protein|eukprot:SAG25_NODE_1371_length_3186_cov_115.281503_2_plen_149_part_00